MIRQGRGAKRRIVAGIASGTLVALFSACGEEQPVVSGGLAVPRLSPSALGVEGAAPPFSRGLVLTDSMVVCVGDNAFKQVVCAPEMEWARATRFGREGGGPGEFRSISELGLGAGGSVIVSDFENRRLTWVSPTEERLLRELPAPLLFRLSGIESPEVVVGAAQLPVPNYLAAPLALKLIAISALTGEVQWTADYLVPEDERERDVRLLTSRGWQLPDGRVGALISPGKIGYWTADGGFLGAVVSPDHQPRTRTEAEAVAYWESLRRGAERFGGASPDSSRTVREAMKQMVPPYRGDPRLGPGGTVWFLCTGDGVSSGAEFEVFQGMEHLGRFRIADAAHEFDIRGNTMVILTGLGTRDEFGIDQRGIKFFDITLLDPPDR